MSKKGFSLVEILVVIGIIGILAELALVNFGSIKKKAEISAGQTFSQSLQTALSENLGGDWNFEADNNIIIDSSGNENHGTIIGAESAEGINGNGLKFDGSDDFVEFAKSFFTSVPLQFTVSLWAKPLAASAENKVIFYHSKNGEFMVGYSGSNDPPANQFFFSFKLQSGLWKGVRASVDSPLGQWHHVAAIFDRQANEAKIYVNGKLKGTMQPDDIIASDAKGGTPSMGAYDRRIAGRGVYNYFNGIIDEVRVFTSAPQ